MSQTAAKRRFSAAAAVVRDISWRAAADWGDEPRCYESQMHGAEEWEWDPRWVKLTGEKYGIAAYFADDPESPTLVRSVEWGHGMQPGTPPTQVVSLCTVVAWWIDGLRTGRYVWDREAWRWNMALTMGADPRDATLLY